MSDDLIAWLRGVLDEDERVALGATQGAWTVDDVRYAGTIYAADDTAVVAGGRWGDEASVFATTEDAVHIARHDPASVLADIAAKRAVLGAYEQASAMVSMMTPDVASPVDAIRAAVEARVLLRVVCLIAWGYRHRDGYRAEWAPDSSAASV